MKLARRTIVLAEERPFLREPTADALRRLGTVISTGSGREVLAVARGHPPDLVVTDLELEDMGADSLCTALGSEPRLSLVPVLVLSRSELASDRARVLRAGARDVLSKPVDRLELLASARRFLDFVVPRGLPRVPVQAAVRVLGPRPRGFWQMRNLSRGGAYVEAPRPVRPGAELRIEFEVPGIEGRFRPSARVAWARAPGRGGPPGMGLHFLELDGPSARRLGRYVAQRALPLPD